MERKPDTGKSKSKSSFVVGGDCSVTQETCKHSLQIICYVVRECTTNGNSTTRFVGISTSSWSVLLVSTRSQACATSPRCSSGRSQERDVGSARGDWSSCPNVHHLSFYKSSADSLGLPMRKDVTMSAFHSFWRSIADLVFTGSRVVVKLGLANTGQHLGARELVMVSGQALATLRSGFFFNDFSAVFVLRRLVSRYTAAGEAEPLTSSVALGG